MTIQFLEEARTEFLEAITYYKEVRPGFCTTLFFFSLMAYWFVVATAGLHEDEF